MSKARIATVWLDGCSGCHMSLLDMDEKLADLAGMIELVYSPLVDTKEFPHGVDVTLVEGAVGSEHDRHLIHVIRERTKTLVSLGDCAVTSNIVAMRNPFKVDDVMKRAYVENATDNLKIPKGDVPALLEQAIPLHEEVQVDLFVPGCPPSAGTIYFVLSELLAGRHPDVRARFG